MRASVLGREEKKSGSALPLAIAAALVLTLAGGAYAFRQPLGAFVAGFGDGFTGEQAYQQGATVGAASNPVGTTQAATIDAAPAPGITPPAVPPVTTPAAESSVPPNTPATIAVTSSPSAPAVQSPDTPAQAISPTATPLESLAATEPTARDERSAADGMKRLLAAKRAARQDIASNTPPREVAAPRTPKIVVVTIGDNAITGPARQRIEERLMDAGFDVADADVLGIRGSDVGSMLRSLRGDATVAIVVKADGIGQQTMNYYGQSSELYTVNLSVKPYLVGEARALGTGFQERVDFTTLSANDQAEAAIAPRLDRLLGAIAQYRRGRG